MKKTRNLKFIVAIGFQLLIIGVLGISLFLTYQKGADVLLAIEPIDPRDPLRGDYVTFSYKDISRIDIDNSIKWHAGETVYVSLLNNDKYGRPESISKEKPANQGIFIKGIVSGVTDEKIEVLYGIEEYFIPEGTGVNFSFWDKDVSAKVSVGKNGKAVLKQIYVDDKEWP